MRPITHIVIINLMQNPDDFDTQISCEEFYANEPDPWEDDEDEDEDEQDDEDYEYDDDDEYYEDDEDDDEDEDEDWEDMEDDVSNMFRRDGTVSENGFAALYDMERRGYFA